MCCIVLPVAANSGLLDININWYWHIFAARDRSCRLTRARRPLGVSLPRRMGQSAHTATLDTDSKRRHNQKKKMPSRQYCANCQQNEQTILIVSSALWIRLFISSTSTRNNLYLQFRAPTGRIPIAHYSSGIARFPNLSLCANTHTERASTIRAKTTRRDWWNMCVECIQMMMNECQYVHRSSGTQCASM